jgi:hypothetical protein
LKQTDGFVSHYGDLAREEMIINSKLFFWQGRNFLLHRVQTGWGPIRHSVRWMRGEDGVGLRKTVVILA